MEWWSVDQFASWQDSVLWVPHHTAALLCCLLVFLLVWKLSLERAGWRSRWAAIALAGAAFASAFGLSIYVTAGFALLMFALVWRQLMIGSPGRMLARNLVFAAVASAVASAPFLFELMTSHSSAAAGEAAGAGHVLAFGIRRLVDPALLTGLPAFASINTAHPILLDTLMRLLLLPIGLALELGVYGVVFWLVARGRHPLGQTTRAG